MGYSRSLAGVVFLLSALAAVVAVGCGGGGDAGPSTSTPSRVANERTVAISEYTYRPAQLVVAKGAKVRFLNLDSTAHTATSKAPDAFGSGTIQPGKSATITLSRAGTFTYYCAFHPFMKGTIVVK